MSAPGFSLEADADLSLSNTLRVPARAPLVARLRQADALPDLLHRPELRGLPLLVLGDGSNVLFAGDPEAVVLRPLLRGIEIIEDDADEALVRAGAGESWDGLVDWTLARGLFGLENLALIPGSVGAAPVQNIGAYGRELDSLFHSLVAWDRESASALTLQAADCGFRYRGSRFRDEAPERWIILTLTLRLSRRPELRLDYPGIRDTLHAMDATDPTPGHVAEAVRHLRRSKLPDPARIGNAGSFFKNPVVADSLAEQLSISIPGLPRFAAGQGRSKIAAAALIEAAGLKGLRRGDAGVSEQHALVLVNHGRATGAALLALAREVRDEVRSRFNVTLEPEPRIVGAEWT
jgi:UDP-N-acetylmuramate dehydrogenase